MIKTNDRLGKSLILAGFSFLYFLSIEPISDTIIKPLEKSTPTFKENTLNADAIVVLTGGVKDLSWLEINPEPSHRSLKRLISGIRLYKKFGGIPLVIAGGSGDPSKQELSEAEAMVEVALSIGLSPEDIIVENVSRNTYENAKALKRLLGREKRIILVTSAFHMKRASAMFRNLGFDVIPAPCDYISEQRGLKLYSFIPNADNLQNSSTAIYEYMSLFWYKIMGVI